MSRRGLIVLAHGARDASWAAPFEAMVARVRERAPDAEVRLAFLELMAPAMQDVGAELAGLGCTRVDVLPVFLGAGGVSVKVFGGIMLGISFVLLNNVVGHLGLLHEWTPWIAASVPSVVYLLMSMSAFAWLVRYR